MPPPPTGISSPHWRYNDKAIRKLRTRTCDRTRPIEDRLAAAEQWVAGSPRGFEWYKKLVKQVEQLPEFPEKAASARLETLAAFFVQHACKERAMDGATGLGAALGRLELLATEALRGQIFLPMYEGRMERVRERFSLWARHLLAQATCEQLGLGYAHAQSSQHSFEIFYRVHHESQTGT